MSRRFVLTTHFILVHIHSFEVRRKVTDSWPLLSHTIVIRLGSANPLARHSSSQLFGAVTTLTMLNRTPRAFLSTNGITTPEPEKKTASTSPTSTPWNQSPQSRCRVLKSLVGIGVICSTTTRMSAARGYAYSIRGLLAGRQVMRTSSRCGDRLGHRAFYQLQST
jgi:hypothetical protein